jgi:hypothetical protein
MRITDRIDWTELVSGLLLLGLGSFVFIEALNYRLGQLSSVGPGLFPRALGVILILCGAGTVLASFSRAAPLAKFNWRSLFVLSVSLLAFALILTRFGMVPAIMALVLFARFSETEYGFLGTFLLASALALMSWLVFVLALGFPLSAFRWPA